MKNCWEYAGASVQGSSHVSSNTPCQDFWSACISPNGKWMALAVCDGAGSALRAEEGSRFVAKLFVEKLIDLSIDLETKSPGAWVNDCIIQSVLDTRLALREHTNTDLLSDFHTTLVACLQGPSGGFAMHIGDGAVVGGFSKGKPNTNIFVSNPHNGEYANETFFITENDWSKNLRIAPMPPTDWMILVTDGGWSLGMERNGHLSEPRLSPLLKALKENNPDQWSAEIKSWLSNKEFDPLTSDDKTFVIAFRDGAGAEPLNLEGVSTTRTVAHSRNAGSQRELGTTAAFSQPIPKSNTRLEKSKWNLLRNMFWIALVAVLGLVGALGLYFFSGFDLDRSMQLIIQKKSILQDVVPSTVMPPQPQPPVSPKGEIRT